MGNEHFCKVSVIVPVYRVEGYIDRCIKSLLRQTLEDIEILCICEKEDSSYQKLLVYEKKDSRVIVIEKKNTGVSSARNAGIKAAKGKYIAFVDADDWVEKYALKLLYTTAEQYKAQIIAYGIWPTVEPESDKKGIFSCTPVRDVLYHNNGIMALFYEHGSRPYIGNKFYNRNFLEENCILFNESIDVGEDLLLQFEVFGKAERVCLIKEKLYHYDIKRNNSAMNICNKQNETEEKNLLLLNIIMQQKRERYQDKYDKEYMAWILQEYRWLVNQKAQSISENRRKEIFRVQSYLKEMSVEQYVCDLPVEYQYIYERFLSYQGSDSAFEYIRMPYWEYDAYMAKQTMGLYKKISVEQWHTGMMRKVYELFAFHEFRHWMVTVPERIVQKYKICKARRIRKTNK